MDLKVQAAEAHSVWTIAQVRVPGTAILRFSKRDRCHDEVLGVIGGELQNCTPGTDLKLLMITATTMPHELGHPFNALFPNSVPKIKDDNAGAQANDSINYSKTIDAACFPGKKSRVIKGEVLGRQCTINA